MPNAVVIPCFDEAGRLDVASFAIAIERRPDWRFVFVDDGSTDGTAEVLESLRETAPARVEAVQLPLNRGKAEAVRHGMLRALDSGAKIVAYADADLSAPFEELDRIVARLAGDERLVAVLGSRFRHLGADIRRSELRHLIGRVYATIASAALGVGIYDTQCGAKAFRATPTLSTALKRPFTERWAFDVELLSRLTRGPQGVGWDQIVEEPLKHWHAKPGSKVRPLEALRATIELLRIGRRHRQDGAVASDRRGFP